MGEVVASIQPFTLTRRRQTPYLGPLQSGEAVNRKGYFVRKGNRTVYPDFDRSVLVRVDTRSGISGWGETYGLVAPGAVGEIIKDLLAEFVIGRDASDPPAIHDDLYDLVRVRGYSGGFYGDALAALDIAIWDIAGKAGGQSVANMLGGRVRTAIPAYLSGLPRASISERTELALEWQSRGFDDFKFASPAADEGPATEIKTLRSELGPGARIAADLHWAHEASEALALIDSMNEQRLWFAEAPVKPEDAAGLATVAAGTRVPIAVGEEWRSHHDMVNCTERCSISIVQPEMGHTGITNFVRIAELAERAGIDVIPHATIGSGIFLAASLQAASALKPVVSHEFQHSIFEPNRHLIDGPMDCSGGCYSPPAGAGIGVEPSGEALSLLEPL